MNFLGRPVAGHVGNQLAHDWLILGGMGADADPRRGRRTAGCGAGTRRGSVAGCAWSRGQSVLRRQTGGGGVAVSCLRGAGARRRHAAAVPAAGGGLRGAGLAVTVSGVAAALRGRRGPAGVERAVGARISAAAWPVAATRIYALAAGTGAGMVGELVAVSGALKSRGAACFRGVPHG